MKDQLLMLLFGLKSGVFQQVSKQIGGNISMVQNIRRNDCRQSACTFTRIHIEKHTCLRERRGLRLNLRVFTTTASDMLKLQVVRWGGFTKKVLLVRSKEKWRERKKLATDTSLSFSLCFFFFVAFKFIN